MSWFGHSRLVLTPPGCAAPDPREDPPRNLAPDSPQRIWCPTCDAAPGEPCTGATLIHHHARIKRFRKGS